MDPMGRTSVKCFERSFLKKHCIAQIVCILDEIWEAGIGVRSRKRKRKKGGRDVCVMIIRDDPILSGEEGGKEKEGALFSNIITGRKKEKRKGGKYHHIPTPTPPSWKREGGKEEKAN